MSINQSDWSEYLLEAFEAALLEASIEVCGGSYTPIQLEEMVNQEQVLNIALSLISLTYEHSTKELLSVVKKHFINLHGGQDWLEKRI